MFATSKGWPQAKERPGSWICAERLKFLFIYFLIGSPRPWYTTFKEYKIDTMKVTPPPHQPRDPNYSGTLQKCLCISKQSHRYYLPFLYTQ